jgi:TP901 family phage tail tape measure protein
MADAQRTIDLIFNGVDKTGAATMSALNNVSRFSGNVQGLTQPIADFTLGAVKLEGALLASGLAMTLFATKAAGDFDSAFREIATLLEQPIDDLDEFREAILSYASTSTAPLEQVTTAIYNAISAGVPLEQSIAAVSAAERLSIAGKADLNETLRVLVSSLNAYGLGMDDADRFSDALFTTVRLGQTTLPELASSLSNVTGAAAAVGVPFETILAAISTLTAAGTPTAQAVTQINAVLTSLIKPSGDAATLAAELGIEFSAQAVRAKGLEVVLADVARATGGNQEQMGRLFGSVEALKAVFPLTGTAAQKFSSDLAAMAGSAGATEAAFAKMAEDIGLSAQKVSGAFRVLLVSIGTPLLDEFGGIAQSIAAVFAALGVSVREGELKNVVAFIEGLFGELQLTLVQVAANLPKALANADLSGFTGGIQAVVDAFKSLFGAVDLSTVNGLTRAVELAGAAFLGLSKFTAGVVQSFEPLFNFLVKLGSQIDKVNPDWLEFAGNIGGAVTQFNLLLGGIGGLVPALQVLVGLMVANNALSMLSAVRTLALALPALSAGFVALGSAFILARLYDTIKGLVELREATQQLAEAQQRSNSLTEVSKDVLDRFNQTTGLAVKTVDEASAAIDKGQVVWSEAANGWVTAGSAMAGAGKAAEGVALPIGEANQAMLDAAEAAAKAADAADGYGQAQQGVQTFTMQIVEVLDEATGKVIGYTQQLVATEGAGRRLGQASGEAARELKTSGDVMTELSRKTNLTNAELIELAKNVKAAEIELEKIASNERIKNIEAKVSLDIARLEADTKRVEAAFTSIDNTVNSTGDLLGDLFGLFKDFDNLSFGAIRQIERQIESENRRRDDALKLQKELTQAQIAQLRAQTRNLERGDSLIKVDGAGLQPHLEAFMFEILRAIQVRVNADGLRLLLGT